MSIKLLRSDIYSFQRNNANWGEAMVNKCCVMASVAEPCHFA